MRRAAIALLLVIPAVVTPAVAQTAHHTHPAATAPEDETEHVVKAGETLGGVAARAKVPRVLIIEANHLKPPYEVHEGQHLMLPRTRHHTVKDGETGFAIAMRYGVPLSAIETANGLSHGKPLKTGQKLLIPTLLKPAETAAAPDRAKPDEAPERAEPKSDSAKSDGETPGRPHFTWPVEGKVGRGYVARTKANHHDGIDIIADAGTAVRAATDGKVVFAGIEPQQFGNLVVIDGARPWQTVYGFLGKITVQRGQTVHAHERIGTVGHSGKAPRPELHFEIRKSDAPIDPQSLLSAITAHDDAAKAEKPKRKKLPSGEQPL